VIPVESPSATAEEGTPQNRAFFVWFFN
jgi:hypothetical protein